MIQNMNPCDSKRKIAHINIRMKQAEYEDILFILKNPKTKTKYNSKSHLIRCAVIKLCRDEKNNIEKVYN